MRGRVPSRRGGGVAAGDLLAIEIGDEAAVVFHPQPRRIRVGLRNLEWNAEINGGVAALHGGQESVANAPSKPVACS